MSEADRIENSRTRLVGETHSNAYRRLRLALDVILILLMILIASGNRLAVRAGSAGHTVTAGQPAPVGEPMMAPKAASRNAQSAATLIDNNTLAEVIAAENAALTPPLYFSDLPLIKH